MPALLVYVVQCSMLAAVVHILYMVFLRAKPLYAFSRFFLNVGVLLSALIPLMHIRQTSPNAIVKSIVSFKQITIHALQPQGGDTIVGIDWLWVLSTVCLCIAIVNTCILLFQGFKIWVNIKNSKKVTIDKLHVLVDERLEPSSFFNYIFLKTQGQISSPIFEHEKAHVQLGHSHDKLLHSLLTAICWWCLPYYFIRKELYLVHEFQADERAAKMPGSNAYAQLLLSTAVENNFMPLKNQFSFHPLKFRIKMLHKKISTRSRILSYLTSTLGLSSLLLTALAFQSFVVPSVTKSLLASKIANKQSISETEQKSVALSDTVLSQDAMQIDGDTTKLKLKKGDTTIQFGDSSFKAVQDLEDKRLRQKAMQQISQFNEGNHIVSFRSGPISVVAPHYTAAMEPLRDTMYLQDPASVETKMQVVSTDFMQFYNDNVSGLDKNATRRVEAGAQDTIIVFNATTGTTIVQLPRESTSLNSSEQEAYATYPGGEEAMQKHIVRSVRYPREAINAKKEGVVIVGFSLDANGKIVNAHLYQKVHPAIDKEALRVVSTLKPFVIDGKHSTIAHKVYFLPISFVL
ncbi:MAG: hypothetical protein RL660_2982 [Bacteroidota bacterium]